MFYLTIVNTILRHCHSWLARQYIYMHRMHFKLIFVLFMLQITVLFSRALKNIVEYKLQNAC